MASLLWALDLATACGWASGAPGSPPASGVWRLKERSQHPSVAGSNLLYALNDAWTADKPYMVVKEAPPSLQGFKNLGNAAYTVTFTIGLHAIVEALCVRHGIPFESPHASTVRKHFVGRGRFGSRQEAKAAVVRRCHLLKLMPRDCSDDNRADALATWDYGAATMGSKRLLDGNELYLFGEAAHD